MSLGALALEALGEQLRQIHRHEAATRRGRDIRALHDMRVAVRRSRAAISLFRDAIDPAFRPLGRELAWLGDELGRVRDLDMLGERISVLATEPPAMRATELLPLVEALAAERRQARSSLLAALDSDAYPRLLEQFRRLVLGRPMETEAAAESARPLVDKRRRAFERAAARLGPEASAKRRHRVRILAKRYRYALEFIARLLTLAERKLPKRLAELQDALGAEQDAAVAIGRLEALAKSNPRAGPAAALLATRFAQLAERVSKGSDRRLTKLIG